MGHKLARSTRTLPEYVPHDMIQSGRTCVQMTEHLMLLRVEACCALSWCSKQVNSLSVLRSVDRPTTTSQPRRGQSACGCTSQICSQATKCQALVLRLSSRMLAPLARHTSETCAIWCTRNTYTATCSRDSGSAATGRRNTMLASACG